MDYRILIVDDEPPARQRMKELLADCRAEVPHVLAGEAANGVEALELLERVSPDIVLVDMHMPGMSGLEFARHAQLLERPPALVFVTAHDQFAVQAFEVNAVDYLLKPVRAARLAAALQKAGAAARRASGVFEQIDNQPRRFFSVSERGRIRLVAVSDVLFLRSEQKYVALHTRGSGANGHLIEESLSALEEEFAGVFVRIHRNCLAARRLIRGVEKGGGAEKSGAERSAADDADGGEGWLLVLEGCEEKLPVSRRQWPSVKSLLKA